MSLVTVADAGPVRTVTLNRQEKRNALTRAMYTELARALRGADANGDIHAVLLQGVQGVFTAGNDLTDFVVDPPDGLTGPVADFLEALVAFTKPLVARVEGPAVGIGTTMLLHCDLVYASPTARFRLPFVNLGLVPEAGSSFLLPATSGHRMASSLLLLGQPFDGETARQAGIVTAVVADDAMDATVHGVLAALCAQPVEALIATKRLMREPMLASVRAAMRAEGEEFVRRLQSPEAIAAFTAFLGR